MESELTGKQQRFVEEYVVDMNATQAAIRAGYSIDSARAIGCENLTKPYIRDAIKAKLEERTLEASETKKLISDIARSNLNEYFVVRQIQHTPQIRKSVADIITELEQEYEFEQEYAEEAGLSDAEKEIHFASLLLLERRILRMRIMLKRDPFATMIVPGPTELVEVAELDMAKLVTDKEAGKIKTFTQTKNGIKVELYPIDSALRDLARMYGLFEKDNDQRRMSPGVIILPHNERDANAEPSTDPEN